MTLDTGRRYAATASTNRHDAAMASLLERAWNSGEAIDPLSDRIGPHDAYAVQQVTGRAARAGRRDRDRAQDRLTSAAMRQLAGVDEPDHGHICEDVDPMTIASLSRNTLQAGTA